MDKFRNKYRIESNRLKGWDYSNNGIYFITMVTENRDCVFGEIQTGEMVFSAFGEIAYHQWFKSFEIRNELLLDEFILMPNHLHAIIVLDNNRMVMNGLNDYDGRDARPCVSTSTPIDNPLRNQPLQRQPKSISSFVAGYKSAVTNKIDDYIDSNMPNTHKYNKQNQLWQANYHDHIIRNDASYQRIKNYIINNPAKWSDDKFCFKPTAT